MNTFKTILEFLVIIMVFASLAMMPISFILFIWTLKWFWVKMLLTSTVGFIIFICIFKAMDNF